MINSTKYHKNTNEDPKTSTIFENLLLLPDDIFWDIIRDSTINNNNDLPPIIGSLKHNEFWPKWDPTGTTNKNYVEPDLFFRFSDYDFIVEAKLSDESGQYYDEWEREVIAYSNEYSEEKKKVFLLAVGGNQNFKEEFVPYKDINCKILKYKWTDILEHMLEAKNSYIKKKTPLNYVLRIFNLLEEGFHIMGINNYEKTTLSSIGEFNSLIKMFNETCNRETNNYELTKNGASFSVDKYNYKFNIRFKNSNIEEIILSLQIWYEAEVIAIEIIDKNSLNSPLLDMIKNLKDNFNNYSIKYLKEPYIDDDWYYIEPNDTFKSYFSAASSFNEQLNILSQFVDELIENYLNYRNRI